MGLISVREVIKTKGIVFFGSQKIVLSSHDSHLAPEMGETHDELLEVDFAIAVIVKDVDDPPEIARYTIIQCQLSIQSFCLSNREVLGSIFVFEGIAGQWTNFWATLLGRGISG